MSVSVWFVSYVCVLLRSQHLIFFVSEETIQTVEYLVFLPVFHIVSMSLGMLAIFRLYFFLLVSNLFMLLISDFLALFILPVFRYCVAGESRRHCAGQPC
jgi:hypothetical protein